MGRSTSGVTGMRLRKDDEVIEINIARDTDDLLVVTEQGYGKRTPVHEYPRKGRGGLGVKTVQLADAKGDTEEAQGIMALLTKDWGYPVATSDLNPNDPIVNTATEYMFQMATVAHHTLTGT